MTLYLLRHAEAERIAVSDAARALTSDGIAQSEKIARFCKKHAIAPEIVLTSPLIRAKRTAEIVISEIGASLEIAPWLASGMSPEIAVSELQAYAKLKSVMIAGHEPDFSRLAAHLLGLAERKQIHLRKGSLTAIEWNGQGSGKAKLEFLIAPDLL